MGSHHAGDPDAFPAIVREHYPMLLARARRHLGDVQAAEDAVQETFLRAYRALPNFGGECRLKAWLFRILDNVCADEGSRRRRTSEIVERLAGHAHVVEAPASEQAQLPPRELQTAVAALPAEYRDAFVRRELHGLGYREIAASSGISEDNARARVSRARTALRRALGPLLTTLAWCVAAVRRTDRLVLDAAGSAASSPVTASATVTTGQLIAYAAPTAPGVSAAAKVAAAVVAVAMPVAGVAVEGHRRTTNDRVAVSAKELWAAPPVSPAAGSTPVGSGHSPEPSAAAVEPVPAAEERSEDADRSEPGTVRAELTTDEPQDEDEPPRQEDDAAARPDARDPGGSASRPGAAGEEEPEPTGTAYLFRRVESAVRDGRVFLSCSGSLETPIGPVLGRLSLVFDAPKDEDDDLRLAGTFVTTGRERARFRFQGTLTRAEEADGLRLRRFRGQYTASGGPDLGLASTGIFVATYTTGEEARPEIELHVAPHPADAREGARQSG